MHSCKLFGTTGLAGGFLVTKTPLHQKRGAIGKLFLKILLQDFGNNAGANRVAAFTNSKA